MRKNITEEKRIYRSVLEDVTYEGIFCNECGEQINENQKRFSKEKWICSMCGKGDWCDKHIYELVTNIPDFYAYECLRFCPECHNKYLDELDSVEELEDNIKSLEFKKEIILDKLWKLRHDAPHLP